MLDEQSRTEADRLYWESEASVADIAEQLEISRRALYDAIRPRPAGLACEECGGELVFRNRTSAERNLAECLRCEREVAVEAVPGVEADLEEPQVEQEREAARLSPMTRRYPEGGGHGAVVGASLLAGLAIGAASAYLFRRR